MLRNLLLILMASTMLWSCGNQQGTSQEQTGGEELIADEKPTVIALADFKDKAEAFVGKEIMLEGNVIHVCKHGGKKMFITADDPDVRIKITSGDDMAPFEPELEGSYVKVLGFVEAIESEVVGEGQLAEEGEHEEGEHVEDADHKNIYHAPQYSVACLKYSVVETTPEEK
jgi:hypothetical protein